MGQRFLRWSFPYSLTVRTFWKVFTKGSPKKYFCKINWKLCKPFLRQCYLLVAMTSSSTWIILFRKSRRGPIKLRLTVMFDRNRSHDLGGDIIRRKKVDNNQQQAVTYHSSSLEHFMFRSAINVKVPRLQK